MPKTKHHIPKNPLPKTTKQVQQKLHQPPSDFNLNLTQDQKHQLLSLFHNIKNINIHSKQLPSQIHKPKHNITKFIQ
ncbi:DUF1002 domain-containing protein, partial [Bacillus altitudinis]|uniref:DUF1002 domain-containing protein n=1 Tax=Bacillus altitudinis TaxID=293387 RepID=UPI002352AFF9